MDSNSRSPANSSTLNSISVLKKKTRKCRLLNDTKIPDWNINAIFLLVNGGNKVEYFKGYYHSFLISLWLFTYGVEKISI